jgi:DNA-binding CsgD family transcriptional regulator
VFALVVHAVEYGDSRVDVVVDVGVALAGCGPVQPACVLGDLAFPGDRQREHERVDPLGLTATEGRVAALAAAGHTNREIAAAAFMSEKTVEANLSRIYRKLGIRSRAELGVRLAALDAP